MICYKVNTTGHSMAISLKNKVTLITMEPLFVAYMT